MVRTRSYLKKSVNAIRLRNKQEFAEQMQRRLSLAVHDERAFRKDEVKRARDLEEERLLQEAQAEEERLRLDLERVEHWVGLGAGLSDRVASLVKDAKKAA